MVRRKAENINQGQGDRKATGTKKLCPKKIDAENLIEKNRAAG